MHLWKHYDLKRQQLGYALERQRERKEWIGQRCPWATDLCSKLNLMPSFLPGLHLDLAANETPLLHGTEALLKIAHQGFDDRLSRRILYGSGVHLRPDMA